MGGLSLVIKLACDGMRNNRLLWALIAGFALFPIYTHFADLPFWNDVAMRIMLLGMAAMGPSSAFSAGPIEISTSPGIKRHVLRGQHRPVAAAMGTTTAPVSKAKRAAPDLYSL